MNDTGSGQLQVELERAIARYAEEGDMSIAEAVGVLEIVKWQLLAKAAEPDEDEDADN